MVEHTRSSTGSGSGTSQPITRHPLFPAIVALWFGALFGLGSLALRPALVEQLVIASGIDAIVPMATPPLGTTMRILVALALTGLGGIIGFVVARRLAAPATAPAPAAVTGTGRRRSLSASAAGSAVLNEATTILDPLILDVADLDPDGLDGPAIAPAPALARARAREMAFGTFVTPTATLNSTPNSTLAKAVEATEEPASFETRLFDSYARDLPTGADIAAETPADAGDEPEPGFTLLAPLDESTFDEPVPAEMAADEPIEPATPETEAPSPVLVEAAAFIMAEPVRNPAPFVVPFAAPMAMPMPVAVSQPESRLAVSRLVNAPLDELSPVELLERLALAMARRREEDARLALAEAEAEAEAEAVAAAAVAAQIAEAEAQARVEQARAEAAVTIATSLAADPAPVAEQPVMQEPVEETVAVEPAAFTPPPPVKFERLSLRAVQFEAPTQSVAVEQPEADDDVANTPAQEAPFAAAESDEAQNVAESIEEATPELAEPAPFAMPRVPRALRPVDPFAFQDDDDDALPGYIPPRHIGRAAPFASPDAFVSPAAFASEAPAVEEAEVEEAEDHSIYALDEPEAEPDAEEEGETLDTGYSSLLSLSRPATPRQSFIRIDEPEETGETPPMVVFPGNEPEAAPAAEAAHGLASIPSNGPRLFDGPARADADGTERALRAALATLQRMSGAA